jgi:hypothetical protein
VGCFCDNSPERRERHVNAARLAEEWMSVEPAGIGPRRLLMLATVVVLMLGAVLGETTRRFEE